MKWPAAVPLGRDVTVLTRDGNGLGALYKPAGTLSHPNGDGTDGRALLLARYDRGRQAYTWKEGTGECALFLLNRLDSATSGVILVAAAEALAVHIRALFRERQVSKTYVARVFGRLPKSPAVWRDRLQIEKSGGVIRSAAGTGILSESVASLLRTGKGEPVTSLLRLEPRTGRSHQLRVQCASRHLPIVGDQTYGDFRRNREFARTHGTKRLFLHSLETRFEYDWKGRTHSFSAHTPLPPDFEVGL